MTEELEKRYELIRRHCPSYSETEYGDIPLLPLLAALDARLGRGERTVLCIDGQCGSGKTSIASLLCKIYGAGAVHMDDFFVPPELRDAEHAALPVHYERFIEEVIPMLRSGEAFSYRVFDCSRMELCGRSDVRGSLLTVVEGSYSMAPVFGKYYDISVFTKSAYPERIRRLGERCGDTGKLMRFIREWIPREERYRSINGTDRAADFTIST